LTDEEIVAQISTLVFAAFDTTSGAIVRTLQVLADYPEIQSRLRDEIVKAVNANGGLDLDYDMLENLPYLNAVCAETLRL
jgi:cytochrome P450